MKIPPKDFFELLEAGAFNRDLRIVVTGQWCSFVIAEMNYSQHPASGEMSAMLTGELLPDEDFEGHIGGSTAARLGEHDIPCEVFCISVEHNKQSYPGESAPMGKRIKAGIIFTYSKYSSELGDFTDSEGEIPIGVKHMIEIEKNPRKRTVFDILDLD